MILQPDSVAIMVLDLPLFWRRRATSPAAAGIEVVVDGAAATLRTASLANRISLSSRGVKRQSVIPER